MRVRRAARCSELPSLRFARHVALVSPKGHEDLVPFLVDNNLLGQDGFGAGLFLHQVVFSHKHPVGELGAEGENKVWI